MSQTRRKFPDMLKVLVSPTLPHTTSLVLLLKRTGQEEIYCLEQLGKLPGFHPCPLWILQEAGWVAISVPAIPVWLLADLLAK